MNILVGSIKHCNRDRVNVWAESASKFVKGRKVLLCLDDIIPNDLYTLSELGFEVLHYPTDTHSDINVSKFQRHLISRKFIQTLNDDDVVLLSDTLDIVFQDDPFNWYQMNKKNNILLTSEGIKHIHEHWNMGGVNKSFGEFSNEITSRDVFNAGIICGDVKYIKDLLLFIYLLSSRTKPENSEGVDQPSMNVVISTNIFNDKIQVTTSSESYGVNCAVAGPTEQFVGWGFQRNYLYDLPKFDGINVVNKDNIPYCIVHQYNRVGEWDRYFKQKYNGQ